jgi:large subunit ribosomal protein L23
MSKKTEKAIQPYMYDAITRPVVTEKSTLAAEHGKVVFYVPKTANKQEVKASVEALFNVEVTKVNTILLKGKNKRFRGMKGKQADKKKAIVTLAEGQEIDAMGGAN